jgi:AcrR family transcriptional regulator
MASSVKKPVNPCADDGLGAARCEEILTQAARLFAERGFDNTDTTLLAETVGLGKGTVYKYFPSKRDLFLAAADRVMRMLREQIEGRVSHIQDPLERIASAIREFLVFFSERPEFVELLIQERALFKDRKRSTFMEHRETNVERWRHLYTGLIADGRVRNVPVDRITDVIGNLLYGTIFTNYFSGQTKSVDKQSTDIIDVVFRGILSPEELKHIEATCIARQSEETLVQHSLTPAVKSSGNK